MKTLLVISGFIALHLIAWPSIAGHSTSTWTVEFQTKLHGQKLKELWLIETDPQQKGVVLVLSDGRREKVPLVGEEFNLLSSGIGPLSVQKRKFLELGFCSQFVRINSEFGSRKFCRKQFRKNQDLAELIAKLEIFRRRTLR
jgi:hypothetical protein